MADAPMSDVICKSSEDRAREFRQRLGQTMENTSLIRVDEHVAAPRKHLSAADEFNQSMSTVFQGESQFPTLVFQMFEDLCFDEVEPWKPPTVKKTANRGKGSGSANLRARGPQHTVVKQTLGPIVRCRLVCKVSVKQVVAVLSDPLKFLPLYDLDTGTVELLDETKVSNYQVLKLGMKKNRQAVIGRVHRVLSGGHCFLAKSVEYTLPDPTNHHSKKKRVSVGPRGFFVRRISSKRCEIIYLNHNVAKSEMKNQVGIVTNVMDLASKLPLEEAPVKKSLHTIEEIVGGKELNSEGSLIMYLFHKVLSLGCEERGIFRISILIDEKARFEQLMFAKNFAEMDKCTDPHVFAVSLKGLFFALPSLLPYEDLVVNCKPIASVWPSIAPLKRQILVALATFVITLALTESQTLMDEKNLIIVLGPGILREEKSLSADDLASSGAAVEDMMAVLAREHDVLESVLDFLKKRLNKNKNIPADQRKDSGLPFSIDRDDSVSISFNEYI